MKTIAYIVGPNNEARILCPRCAERLGADMTAPLYSSDFKGDDVDTTCDDCGRLVWKHK